MGLARRKLGSDGENYAAQFLRRKGYAIVQRNFRCHAGEIDIIARHKDCLVFIEVRTRKSPSFGTPEESITPVKKQRLIALAEAYVQGCEAPPEFWRIDVVAIEISTDNRVLRLNHIENAVY